MMLRVLVLAVSVVVCSTAAPKKALNVAFVAVSGHESASALASVANELKSRANAVQVTLFTYPSYSTFLYKYLQENETVLFNDPVTSIGIDERIEVVRRSANCSCGHFMEFLNISSDNYNTEVSSLKMFNVSNKPDLFVVDTYSISGMDIANELKVPYIIYTHDTMFNSIGPDPFADQNRSFVERLQSLLQLPSEWQMMSQLSKKLHEKRHLEFATTYKPLSFLYADRMQLIPTVFGLEVPIPVSPLLRLVGMPVNRDKYAKKPSNGHEKVLLSWLNAENQSAVLFCQFAEDASPSATVLMSLVEGGLSAGLRVLVSVRHQVLSLRGIEYNDIIKGREDSVNIVPFAPIAMVLSSKAVKVFLYQGSDMATIAEGVYAAMPLLLLPATTNHRALASRIVNAKMGLQLSGSNGNLTSDDVRRAVEDLQVDKTRRRIVKRLKWLQTVNDQAGSFTNGSVAVIQEVLAAAGYTHLIVPVRTEEIWLRHLTQYGVDVFLVGVGMLFVVLHVIVLLCCCSSHSHATTKRKQE